MLIPFLSKTKMMNLCFSSLLPRRYGGGESLSSRTKIQARRKLFFFTPRGVNIEDLAAALGASLTCALQPRTEERQAPREKKQSEEVSRSLKRAVLRGPVLCLRAKG